MSAAKFIAAARALKGARWRHRGRSARAVDCIGLVVLAAREAGINARDQDRYGREPWEDRLRQAMVAHFGKAHPVSAARPGAVALIRWRKGDPTHIAIVGDHPNGGLTLIHAHNIHGVVECSLAEPYASCVVEIYLPFGA